ncbi:MAG: glycosyltransferase family 4 protein [Bacillota bacterium]|nr:glycosyltransferase family 4 protein [Bacillota bacterium]
MIGKATATMDGSLLRGRTVFLSTYPPQRCGIATFTQHLVETMAGLSVEPPAVVAVSDGVDARLYPDEVVAVLDREDRPAYRETARMLNRSGAGAVVVEHEYGIFGGTDGSDLLELTDALEIPWVVTLHTVLRHPTARQRAIIRRLAERARRVVVLAQRAQEILVDVYRLDPSRLVHIPHGAPDGVPVSRHELRRRLGLEGATVLCTLGLINPGKGIEYVIDALPILVQEFPDLLYLVLGQTHPGILRQSGESYREMLKLRARQLGVEEHVRFVDTYLDDQSLVEYLVASDIYITPYLSPEQISSGTLAYAVGLGKAVISTPYAYAQELLADGRGLLVPFRDAEAIAEAVRAVLGSPRLRRGMERRARLVGRSMAWPRVAEEYLGLLEEVKEPGSRRGRRGGPVVTLAGSRAVVLGAKGGIARREAAASHAGPSLADDR